MYPIVYTAQIIVINSLDLSPNELWQLSDLSGGDADEVKQQQRTKQRLEKSII